MTRKRPAGSDIVGTLELEEIEDMVFEGLSPDSGWGRIFGGQVLGQALAAGQMTIADLASRPTHSFHAHFLRPGNPDTPIRFEVENIRDGRSFSTRHIRATQNGKGILMMTASFQEPEQGFEHQVEMPKVPLPDDIDGRPMEDAWKKRMQDLPEAMQKRMTEPRPLEMRFTKHRDMADPEPGDPEVDVWFRVAEWVDLPKDDLALNNAIMAYASDMQFMDTALVPHGSSLMDPKVHGVSLDHGVWLHEPVDVKEWMLFVRKSHWAANGRGFVRGKIFSESGRLVATVVQECLIRRLES